MEGARTPRRSSCFMAEWMQMEGKLHSASSLFSSFARSTLFTKITICGSKAMKSVVSAGTNVNLGQDLRG